MNKLMKAEPKPPTGKPFCRKVYSYLFHMVARLAVKMAYLGLFLLDKAREDTYPPCIQKEEEVRHKSIYEEGGLG